jgi:hypothetical protein
MDMNWLAGEAKQIHALFSALFYSIVVVMICLGVVLNFFKMSLGQVPEFMSLVGRAVLAAFILAAFPEIMNTLADVTDHIAKDIGQLNNIKLVVHRLGEKIGKLSFSWVSVKDSVLLIVSYLTFFLLYISVYIADAMYLLTWTLLYIFSPVLIAAFTLPSTASATKGLFQSLIEVCLWKVSWAVLAALLWSFALSEINSPKYDVDFLTAIVLNVMLAFSVLLTPLIVRSMIKGGMSSSASSMGTLILAAAALTPNQMLAKAKWGAQKIGGRFGKQNDEDDSDDIPPYRRALGPGKFKRKDK